MNTSLDSRTEKYGKSFREQGVQDSCALSLPRALDSRMLAANTPSLGLLEGLSPHNVTFPTHLERNEVERLLRRAMWAEHDAECLCKELDRRVATEGLKLSPQFREFERLWRMDELDHTLGFVRLYSALFGTTDQHELVELAKRRGNFSKMEELFKDELTIALVIAYDEMATIRSYSADAGSFYPHLGFPGLVPWIKRLAGDEGRHFANCITVIKTAHADRKAEIPGILERIVALDKEKNAYAGTFVLDHDDDQFSSEMLEECKNKVLRALSL